MHTKMSHPKLNQTVIEVAVIVASGSLLGIFVLLLRNTLGGVNHEGAFRIRRV